MKIVQGQSGNRARITNKSFGQMTKEITTLTAGVMKFDPEYLDFMEKLVMSAPEHSLDGSAIKVSSIIFPLDSEGVPQLYTMVVSKPSMNTKRPILNKSEVSTDEIVKIILGTNDYDKKESLYVNIAPMNGKNIVVVIPEKHEYGAELLQALNTMSYSFDGEEHPVKCAIKTKIMAGDGSLSRSQSTMSYPKFKMWFDRCPTIYTDAVVREFFHPRNEVPTKTGGPPTPRRVNPRNPFGVSRDIVSTIGRGKAGYMRPGAGKGGVRKTTAIGRGKCGKNLSAMLYRSLSEKIVNDGSHQHDKLLASCFVTAFRNAVDENVFRDEMIDFVVLDNPAESLAEDYTTITGRYNLGHVDDVVNAFGDAIASTVL